MNIYKGKMGSWLRNYQFISFLLFFLYSQAYISSSFTNSSMKKPTCSHKDGQALLQFKQTLFIHNTASFLCNQNYGITSFLKTDSWKEDIDCCLWDGVSCDRDTGHVIGLDLSCSWLYGTITSNSSLFFLQHLKMLNLAFNNFRQSNISPKFGQFPHLTHLNLSSSYFSGQVPSEISHLSKLVSLDLSILHLSKLVSLDLSRFSLPFLSDQEPFPELKLETTTLKWFAQNFSEVKELFLDGIDMFSVDPGYFMNLSSSLTSLSLDDCGLNGTISDRIFQFPNLKLLKLGNNPVLVVYLPKSNGTSTLEILDLKQTVLLGKLSDSIRGLKSLKSLNLASCDLNGSIPTSMGNLSQIVVLELSDNNFSGWIPASLANLTQLQHLDLSYNDLEGIIPPHADGLSKLVSLCLPSNLLIGTIPPWVFELPSLKLLSLANNRLMGQISKFQSKSLSIIYFKNNMLQGQIPSSIFQLVNLTVLDLSLNNFTGIVELDMFSNLQNLGLLDLSHNRLLLSTKNGVNYTLTKLQFLSLSSCNLTEFPNFLRGSKNLKFLDLSKNRIPGQIPQWMWNVGKESLLHLYLDHNFLTGPVQFPWKKVVTLYLQSNLFQGVLPIPPVQTFYFSMANNNMTGEISSVICNATSLRIIDVSHNNLSGNIPSCILHFSKSLLVLNLRANSLHGTIPTTFAERSSLENLNFHGNQMEGPLPRSLANCTNLRVLDLGNNKFSDTFPNWLETLQKLEVLVLSSNKFHGFVNNSGARLPFQKLRVLDLSNNDFVGPFPARYIANLKAMANLTADSKSSLYMQGNVPGSRSYEYSVVLTIKRQRVELVKILTIFTSIDLSNNYFQGVIPEVIGKLNSLKGLNLSYNNFSGHIPPSIGNLANLEWLDLASNKLIGEIPEELVDLGFLAFLNLSNNQLVGPIPQGKQFNTFENSSYEGNIGLCGFPLSKACHETEMQNPNLLMEDSGIGFGWKVVVIGYGCGLIFGLICGYVVFQTGRPKWIVNLVEGKQLKKGKRSKNIRRN